MLRGAGVRPAVLPIATPRKNAGETPAPQDRVSGAHHIRVPTQELSLCPVTAEHLCYIFCGLRINPPGITSEENG